MSDCLFCKIVRQQVPADIIYEDKEILAFKDIEPQAPVHILIIPKKHISGVLELDTQKDAGLLAGLFRTASRLAKENKVDRQGFRLVLNSGPQAGQSVFHIHLHLLGGRIFKWPPG